MGPLNNREQPPSQVGPSQITADSNLQAFRRWPIVVIPLLTFILWHAATIYNATDEFPSSSSSKSASDYLSWLPSGLKHPGFDPSSHHVFIATQPNWHEQVWLTIGGMLSSLKVPYTAYTECDDTAEGETCIRFGLLEMAAVLGVWNGGRKSEPLCRRRSLPYCFR